MEWLPILQMEVTIMNKMKALNQKIVSSKFNITKNFLYFLIVPAVLLIVGIILLSTVGFNLGTDFTGKSTFKIYVNSDNSFGEEIAVYDLSNSDDYNEVYDKIELVIKDNDLKIDSYRTSTMNILDYKVDLGQAVEVSYQNISDDESEIALLNNKVRSDLITAFGYNDYASAVSTIDVSPAKPSFNWAIGIVASIVFAYVVVAIYMAFRYNPSIFVVGLLQIVVDLILTISLVLITRLTVNLSFGIVLLTTFIMSIFNLFYYYSKTKSNLASGRFERAKNSEIANATTKELTFNKSLICIALLLVSILFSALAVDGVRNVALGIMICLIVIYFTSQTLLPSFWSVVFKKKNAKKVVKSKDSKKIPN